METENLRTLLVKNWMTHDAMWFRHCAEECGIEVANRVNRAAVRSMAGVEVHRIQKALGLAGVRDFAGLQLLIAGAWELIRGDFMDFRFLFPGTGHLRVDVAGCFAKDGVTRLGLIDRYECGIFDRIEGWFDALSIPWSVEPVVTRCMMHETGACRRDYRFRVDAAGAFVAGAGNGT